MQKIAILLLGYVDLTIYLNIFQQADLYCNYLRSIQKNEFEHKFITIIIFLEIATFVYSIIKPNLYNFG